MTSIFRALWQLEAVVTLVRLLVAEWHDRTPEYRLQARAAGSEGTVAAEAKYQNPKTAETWS